MAGSIKLAIDFMFEASHAMSGIDKATKGFRSLHSAAQAFTEAVSGSSQKNAFSTFASGFAAATETMKKSYDKLTADINSEALDQGMIDKYAKSWNKSMKTIFKSNQEYIKDISGVSNATASFVANAKVHEGISKITSTVDDLRIAFENLGVHTSLAGVNKQVANLAATNEILFNSFSKTVDESNRMMESLSSADLARYRTEFESLTKSFDKGQVSAEVFVGKMTKLNTATQQMEQMTHQMASSGMKDMKGLHSALDQLKSDMLDGSVSASQYSIKMNLMADSAELFAKSNQLMNEHGLKDMSRLNKEISAIDAAYAKGNITTKQYNVAIGKVYKTVGALEKTTHTMLNSNLKDTHKYKVDMDRLTDSYLAGKIGLEKYEKELNKVTGEMEIKGKIKEAWQGFGKQILGAAGAFEAINDALKTQEQMVATITSMGLDYSNSMAKGLNSESASVRNMGDAIGQTTKDVLAIGQATKVSLTDASQAYNSLFAARAMNPIKDTNADMVSLTTTSIQLTQAFGMSEGAATDFIKSMHAVGNISADGIQRVGDALTGVQRTLGMTAEEATEVGDTVSKVITKMGSMGASSIKNASIIAKEVGKMTVSFTRAGLSAQDASSMIDRFMDPDKISENAFLWSKMGISVGDALNMMSGDGSKMAGMSDKLLKVSNDLMKQYGKNPMVLNEMAKAYGMNTQQVKQLSQQYVEQHSMNKQQMEDVQKNAKLEARANESRESINKGVKQLMETLNIFIASVLLPLANALMPIIQGFVDVSSVIVGFLDNVDKTLPGVGTAVKMVIGALLLWVAANMVLGGSLGRILPAIGGFGKGLMGLGGVLGGLVKKIPVVGGFIDKMGSSFEEASKKEGSFASGLKKTFGKKPPVEGAAEKAGNAASKAEVAAKNPKAKKGSSFLKDLAKVPPQTLLALAVVLVALGAAIAMVALSFAVLANSLKQLDLAQLITLAALGIIILGGFAVVLAILAPVIVALGTAGVAAAPGIMALAVTLLSLGAAVALIVLSFAVLIAAMSLMSGKDVLGPLLALGGAFIILTAALIGLSIAAPALAPGVGILIGVGAAMLMMGAGIALAVLSLTAFIAVLGSLDPAKLAANLGALSAAIVMLAVPLAYLGVVFGGLALVLGVAAPAIAIGIVAMAAMAVTMGLLAFAVGGLAKTFESLKGAITTLENLGTALPQISSSLQTLGASMQSIGADSKGFSDAMDKIASLTIPLGLLNLAIGGVSNSMVQMGKGISDISASSAGAISGLGDFITLIETKTNNFAQKFIAQLGQINSLLNAMPNLLSSIQAQTIIQGGDTTVTHQGPGASDTTAIVNQLDEANKKLQSIQDNTKGTNDRLDRLIAVVSVTNRAYNPETKLNK